MNTPMQKVINEVDVSEVVNKHTGEMLSKPESVEIGTIAPEIFTGISTLDISKDISDRLTQPVRMEDIEIKPTGEIYLSHVRYRKMLNDAFGMGNWSLRPLGGFVKTGSVVCREYALYIKGKYAASAIGEQNYIESNAQMTWSDACEATKSNVIMRCCKDLGIGLEMWDRKFVEKFKREFCVQVWRKGRPGQTLKPQWRLKESEPFFDETGIVDPSKRQVPATQSEAQQHNQELSNSIYGNKIITAVQNITSKPGVGKDKKDKDGNVVPGKPYTIYTIYGDGDVKYSTYDKDIAKGAKTAKENGVKVCIVTKGDKYNSIVSLDLVEPDYSLPGKHDDDPGETTDGHALPDSQGGIEEKDIPY